MARCVVASALATAVLACGSGRASRSAEGPAASDDTPGTARPSTAQLAPDLSAWPLAQSVVYADGAPRDLGIGVLHARVDPDNNRRTARVDTVLFRAEPRPDARMVGVLVMHVGGPDAPPGEILLHELRAPEPLTMNVIEVAYEENGIPVDSIAPDDTWHRAILGFTASGSPWLGWAPVDDVLARIIWKERLLSTDLHFLAFDAGTLHASPNGPVVATAAQLADSGFVMTPVEARWPWLRVKVEHPGGACDVDFPSDRRTDHWWVRALDDRGRPLVYFPTRGC